MQEQKGKHKNKTKNMSIGTSLLLRNKVHTSFLRQTFIVEAVHATLRFSDFITVDCLLILLIVAEKKSGHNISTTEDNHQGNRTHL